MAWLSVLTLLTAALLAFLALSLVWRIGGWDLPTADLLNSDYGLGLGSKAPEIALRRGTQEWHLVVDVPTIIVFGTAGCSPCDDLLVAGARHPALRPLRRVYVSDALVEHPEIVNRNWELFVFDDEWAVRRMWNAPVSPYFHLVGAEGRILAKGVASRAAHLDKLLDLTPAVLQG